MTIESSAISGQFQSYFGVIVGSILGDFWVISEVTIESSAISGKISEPFRVHFSAILDRYHINFCYRSFTDQFQISFRSIPDLFLFILSYLFFYIGLVQKQLQLCHVLIGSSCKCKNPFLKRFVSFWMLINSPGVWLGFLMFQPRRTPLSIALSSNCNNSCSIIAIFFFFLSLLSDGIKFEINIQRHALNYQKKNKLKKSAGTKRSNWSIDPGNLKQSSRISFSPDTPFHRTLNQLE